MKKILLIILILSIGMCMPCYGRVIPILPVISIWARTLLDDTTQGAAQTTLGLGTGDTPTFVSLILSGDIIRIMTSKTPSSASDTGTQGDICWDSDYIYVCIATDTWKRTAISTWTAPDTMIFENGDVMLYENGTDTMLFE